MSAAFNVVCYGEVLWDLLPTGSKPGGAPMNVAYHLKKLGNSPAMISRVGSDDRGTELLRIFQEKGLNTDFIQSDDSLPTGIVNATPNERGEMSYEICAPVAWDNIQWHDSMEGLIRKADHFVFGSLAARSRQSHNTLFKLIERATNKVLDINLRPPHFNAKTVEELLAVADIVKMNEDELNLISEWYGPIDSIEERILLLQEKFWIPTLIITRGANGAIVNTNGVFYEHPGYKVQVADTVGSGDSFLAAYLTKSIHGWHADQALSYACALGSLIATREGGCPDYDLEEIESMLQ